jgi:two-component system cell cycle response regulator DivK
MHRALDRLPEANQVVWRHATSAREGAVQDTQAPEECAGRSEPPPDVAAKRILVIDDDPDYRELLWLVLERLGWSHVVVARDGVEGLRRIYDGRPDLVLLDLMMPDIRGYDVVRWLKADPGLASIPVIAITGAGDPASEEHAREAGCDAFLAKPFELTDLEAVLRIYLT